MNNLLFIVLMLAALLAWHRAKIGLLVALRRRALVKNRASGVKRGSMRPTAAG